MGKMKNSPRRDSGESDPGSSNKRLVPVLCKKKPATLERMTGEITLQGKTRPERVVPVF
jgi:hypothetical protein